MQDDSRQNRQSGADWGSLLVGLGLGAGLAYILDPNQGRRRRAYLRDQAVHAAHVVSESANRTARDVRNRASGMAARATRPFRQGDVDDTVLVERVRSAIGRAVSHPRAIEVTAEDGTIFLSGLVLAAEKDRLLSSASHVPGVRHVENRLEAHKDPGSIPALQPGVTRPGRYGMARQNWPPATRLCAGLCGGSLAAWGAARRDALGAALGLAGLGLIVRSATNIPVDRLTGVGAGRRAVEFRKTINIDAPPEQVFAFCSQFQNFPRFMTHVREIKGGGEHSHWVVDGPAGAPVSWDAVVTEMVPNELLAWKSVDGSMIRQSGIMRFERNDNGGTRLDIRMSYNPPAGAVGHAVASLLGANPERQMDEDFNRLKSLIEHGKTSTAEEGEITRDQIAA
jgi:uncharacterized membrane protein